MTLTADQQQKRLGMFAGSEIHKLMGIKGFGETGEIYIHEKVSEFLTGQKAVPEFEAASVRWGRDHELEAQLYFEAATGLKIEKCDTMDNGEIAGTPDGIITGTQIGFEIKCPYNSGIHLKHLLLENQEQLKSDFSDNYWQCVAYMWLTGFEQWKYCSYDPRFKEQKRMFILNLTQNSADLELLKNRITEAKLIFENLISKLK